MLDHIMKHTAECWKNGNLVFLFGPIRFIVASPIAILSLLKCFLRLSESGRLEGHKFSDVLICLQFPIKCRRPQAHNIVYKKWCKKIFQLNSKINQYIILKYQKLEQKCQSIFLGESRFAWDTLNISKYCNDVWGVACRLPSLYFETLP